MSITRNGKHVPVWEIGPLLIYGLWIVSMFLAFGKRRATLHDRLTKTRVVSTLTS